MDQFGTRKCKSGTTYGGTVFLAVAATLSASIFAPAQACPCSELKVPAEAASMADRRKGYDFTFTPAYAEEFERAIESARKACEQHMFEPNVAVVTDLDETLFDNRELFKNTPDYTTEQLFDWIGEGRQPVLKPTADFLTWAREHGFAVFAITGRPDRLRRATITNLVNAHIACDGLFMREGAGKLPAEQVKAPYREAIEKMGFKIIVNIGDQYSDLSGGHAEDCEKVPNRMYYIR